MSISRRDLLLTSGVFLLGGTRISGQGAAPPRAQTSAVSPSASDYPHGKSEHCTPG